MTSHSQPLNLQRGQEALPSFEHIYDRYHLKVCRYLYAHLGNEHDAADLMQHIFFQAWNQRQTYDPGRGSVATWLFSIAHHRLVDFYRMTRSSISWESLPEGMVVDQNPEAKVIEAESLAQVRRLLEELSQSEQELLALRFAGQLSSREIAALIGKSEAATKKQITRLLHRLNEQYCRDNLEELLPDLLEPVLPVFVSALLQVYAIPFPEKRFHAIRQLLQERIQSVTS